MASGLFVVGLSWRTAPIGVREKLAFADAEVPGALADLVAIPGVGEAVLLSTCNRVEIYGAADKEGGSAAAVAAAAEVRRFLASGRGMPLERLADAIYERTEVDAVRHVFRVASALDSMVVGESQILGQLKDAYGAAVQAGTAGPVLARCLERAFGVAKRVRSETAIAAGSANVSSVAVELARRVFGGLAGKIVLLVGAGKMSALAARHLSSDGAATILVTNRSPERAQELAAAVQGNARPWQDLEAHLAIADIVLSSTGAREPVLTRDLVKRVMKARRHRPIVIIDIAVPRDVDPSVGKSDGVYLFDIDDLERVVAENLKERAREADAAGRIVDDEVAEFARWLRAQGAVPTIRALRERFSLVARAEAERVVQSLAVDHTAAQREQAILRLAEVIVNKLLHSPLSALKGTGDGQDIEALVAAANRLFELPDPGPGAAAATGEAGQGAGQAAPPAASARESR